MKSNIKKENPYAIAREQLEECAKFLKLDDSAIDFLKKPIKEHSFTIPVKMDDGSIKDFQGFRIQHNNALGPFKGGIRFHPEETIDTVRALSMWMTWKTALLGLPLGGGKGGVICDPKSMSEKELENLSRGYVKEAFENIGPDKDVPAPDVYTNEQIMAWMMDEYSKLIGKNQFGVVTGKPLCLGGSIGRSDATAKGGIYAIKEAADEIGLDLKDASVTIQGFGNAGYNMARLIKEVLGCKIIAVSDSQGGIYDSNGLDIETVKEHKNKTGSVINFSTAKDITNQEILELKADILIPAALEDVITKENAPNIKVKILAELANGPTTPEADEILYKNGVHLIPDILCNAGGVTVSYFEMVQNFYMNYWDNQKVQKCLQQKIKDAYHNVLKSSKKFQVNMRMGAYIVAVERVVEAMKKRGWV